METFKRETRYLVFKLKDLFKYATKEEIECIIRVSAEIDFNRHLDEKSALSCVVVEQDWPEYEEVWKMIEKRCTDEQLF